MKSQCWEVFFEKTTKTTFSVKIGENGYIKKELKYIFLLFYTHTQTSPFFSIKLSSLSSFSYFVE